MPRIKTLFALLLALLLSGCFDIETVIRVNPDGSGQVEERMLLGGQMAAMMAMAEQQGGGSSEMFDRAELEKRAREMGSGVRLESVESVEEGGSKGYRALFAFDDINQLQVNQNPGDKTPSGPGGNAESDSPEEPVRFRFTPGDPAELIVLSPMGKPSADEDAGTGQGEGAAAGNEANSEQAKAMMKEMFKDMRIALAIEVQGRIVDTNATYRDGSRVTLMEMEFAKLVQNAEKFEQFAEQNPETIEETKELLQGMDGIKAELEPEIHIRFNGGAPKPEAGAKKTDTDEAAVTAGLKNPGWNTVKPAQARFYVSMLVEVTDRDGRKEKGMLISASEERLRLQRAELDGGGEAEFTVAAVKRFRVFNPGS